MRTRRLARNLCLVASLALVVTATAYGYGGRDAAPNSTGAPASVAVQAGKPTKADRAAVRGLLRKINRAWKRGDATEYASFHTRNADLIDFRGYHAHGRQEIVELLQPLFDGMLKGTEVKAKVKDLRFLSPRVAIMHSIGKIAPVGGRSIQTFIATKGRKGWLIASFQNTRIQLDQ